MKKTIRSLLALLLAVLMVGSLTVAAFAEDSADKYPVGQSYKDGEGDTEVYTVQVSAGPNLDGAERTRDQMLRDGFDCFIVEKDGLYYIQCGKFQDKGNAFLYRELILDKTERERAYVTSVTLPKAAVEEFVEHYKQDPFVVGNVYFNGWETPTGEFVDMTANEEETAPIYVVQFSCGQNFKAAEFRRDELTEFGFDGYVIKVPGFYYIAAGAFDNWDDAYALCKQVRETSGRMGTGVLKIELPVSLLG